MKSHDPGRLAAVLVAVACYVISLVFNALAVVGYGKKKKYIFQHFFSTVKHNMFIVAKVIQLNPLSKGN